MSNSQYTELDKLIKEYEQDSRTIRAERMVMKNYPKVLLMSAASSFEYNIKNRCQDFCDNPKLPIAQNYPKINAIKWRPLVDQMYKKLKVCNKNGVEYLSANNFYELFNGQAFKLRVQAFFVIELQRKTQKIEEQINFLKPLLGTNDQYDADYAKCSDLKSVYERCSFDDAEKAFLSLKLRRNRVAHDYINGMTDTFVDIQNFYDIAVIYVVSLEAAIEELTNT